MSLNTTRWEKPVLALILDTPDLLLETDEEGVLFEGEPFGARSPERGRARTYRVLGLTSLDVELVIFDVIWPDASRMVVAPVREAGNHPRFDGLVGRHRLGIRGAGPHSYMMLGQARLTEGARTAFFWPMPEDLEAGAGVPFKETLLGFGASAVGTRSEVLADSGRHRNRSVVMFDPAKAPHLPTVAFVLTRVAPVARGVAR